MFNGGKKPRYLIDLLFNEDTIPKTCDPAAWHKELDEFIATHSENDGIRPMQVVEKEYEVESNDGSLKS